MKVPEFKVIRVIIYLFIIGSLMTNVPGLETRYFLCLVIQLLHSPRRLD